MSHDESDAHGRADGAQATGTGRSFVGGVKATLKFFAPSLLVGLVAPFVFPAMRRAARPVVKGAIKGALSLSESVKEGAAGAREHFSDLLAEVRAEREKEAADAASSANRDL
jgi:hypothetical protein